MKFEFEAPEDSEEILGYIDENGSLFILANNGEQVIMLNEYGVETLYFNDGDWTPDEITNSRVFRSGDKIEMEF